MATKQEPASPSKVFATLTNGSNNKGKGKQRANDDEMDIEMADWAQAQDPRMWDKLAGETGATMSNLGDPVKTIEVRTERKRHLRREKLTHKRPGQMETSPGFSGCKRTRQAAYRLIQLLCGRRAHEYRVSGVTPQKKKPC